jgi:hypothetical protein
LRRRLPARRTLIAAVLYSAISIFALAALVVGGSAGRLLAISWHEYERPERMLEATR